MEIGSHDTKGGLRCGNRSARCGKVCSARAGPGAEPRGPPAPRHRQRMGEENQERQHCDGNGVTVRERGGRPQVAMRFNTGVSEGREGQGVKAEGPERGIVGGVRSCGPTGSGIRGHSLRCVCGGASLWVHVPLGDGEKWSGF